MRQAFGFGVLLLVGLVVLAGFEALLTSPAFLLLAGVLALLLAGGWVVRQMQAEDRGIRIFAPKEMLGFDPEKPPFPEGAFARIRCVCLKENLLGPLSRDERTFYCRGCKREIRIQSDGDRAPFSMLAPHSGTMHGNARVTHLVEGTTA